MSSQSLTQDELDNTYHQAIFDCEQSVTDALVKVFNIDATRLRMNVSVHEWAALRDIVIDAANEAIDNQEVAYLGNRYDALIERIRAGHFRKQERPL